MEQQGPRQLGPGVADVLDEHGVISRDVTCRKCGYNLRGLHRDGVCPECAAPVGHSLRGDLLCSSDPEYVGTLVSGTRWMRRSATSVLTSAVALAVLALVAEQGLKGEIGAWLKVALAVCAAGCVVAGIVLYVGGMCLITTPEAGSRSRPQGRAPRQLARVFGGAALLCLVSSVVGGSLGWQRNVVVALDVSGLAALGFLGLSAVTAVAYFRHVRGLARRIPNERLNRHAGFLSNAWPVVLGGLALGVLLGPMVAAPLALAGIAGLILMLWTLWLHDRLGDALEEQAALAAKFWRTSADASAVREAGPEEPA